MSQSVWKCYNVCINPLLMHKHQGTGILRQAVICKVLVVLDKHARCISFSLVNCKCLWKKVHIAAYCMKRPRQSSSPRFGKGFSENGHKERKGLLHHLIYWRPWEQAKCSWRSRFSAPLFFFIFCNCRHYWNYQPFILFYLWRYSTANI